MEGFKNANVEKSAAKISLSGTYLFQQSHRRSHAVWNSYCEIMVRFPVKEKFSDIVWHRYEVLHSLNRSVGLGGLGVTCSPRDTRFAGSNPAEVN